MRFAFGWRPLSRAPKTAHGARALFPEKLVRRSRAPLQLAFEILIMIERLFNLIL
jgi:hypothetical protein